MKTKTPPKRINLVIEPQKRYSSDIYCDNDNCYLAVALKNRGFKDVHVSAEGETKIGAHNYSPLKEFNSGILRLNFVKKKATKVTLVLTQ